MFKRQALACALLHATRARGVDIDRLCEEAIGLVPLGSHDGWCISEGQEALTVVADAMDDTDDRWPDEVPEQ